MADPKYSDDNTDGFSSSSGGVIADGTGDTTGDYSDWDWKKIMAAITGGAAYSDPTLVAHPSDPQTLQTAADTLSYVEGVLQEVARGIATQTNALTGEHGPWQGAAARALNGAMSSVAQQTQQMADALSGGVTGDENVPQQLANNAQNLRMAIDKINDINTWYANQALKINPHLKMPNGLVEVHKIPQIVTMMSNDMRQVLTTLSNHYTVSKDSVAQPSSPNNPNNARPNVSDFGIGDPNAGAVPFPGPGAFPNLADFNDPNVQSPDLQNDGPGTGNVPDFGGVDSGPGAVAPGLGVNAPDFGDDTPGADEKVPDFGTGLPGGPGTGAPDDGAGAAPDASSDAADVGSPAPFPGDTSLENGGPDLPTTGQLDPAMDAALNPPAVVPAPGLGLGDDTPAGSVKSPKVTAPAVSPFPGDTGLDTPGGAADPAGAAGASVAPFPGADTPDLDTSGTGAPGLGSLAGGVPDTGLGGGLGSGLGSGPGAGAGSPPANGTVQGFPGDTKLSDAGALGSEPGMPMMPMGGGSAGLGGAGGEVGAPDAAGLLGGDAEPWDGSAALPDGVSGGAEQGGPGLSLPGDQAAAGGPGLSMPGDGAAGDVPSNSATPGESPAAGGPADGMPMMPMGGLGQPGGGDREHERSEASGLLSGTAEPWASFFEGGGDPMGSPHGTPRDEGGLTMPDEDGLAADLFSGQPAAASSADSPGGHLDTEEFLAGTAEWLPYLAAGAAATNTGDHVNETRYTSRLPGDPAAPVWGEAEAEHEQAPWAVAGAPEAAAVPEAAAPEPEREAREHQQAPRDEASHPDAIGADDAPVTADTPVAVATPVALDTPMADDAPSADDPAAWDAAAASLLPLLARGHGAVTSGEEAGAEGDRQDAAAATAVAAGAYTIARSTTADASPAAPERVAWRPKATGPQLVELTCSFDDPPEEPQASAHDVAEVGRGTGAKVVRRERERDGEGGNSVADLLRQGEEVWG
ncbi:WXG100 family type VII secretion target [Streptomyces sp. PTM05]|uniref:WXG100 family type VII secretion target n=1 Tax=Streptantibioticus parmotrematis TaxID=2873249 RepID=A0ABS7QS88_9ACTN|nr:WXG100 family type VII secretion target [Streptantibioticus parmotrematis]MBY8886059.1 WXG100 family type VII secretion target [Streptantibioticus parmotrematis]